MWKLHIFILALGIVIFGSVDFANGQKLEPIKPVGEPVCVFKQTNGQPCDTSPGGGQRCASGCPCIYIKPGTNRCATAQERAAALTQQSQYPGPYSEEQKYRYTESKQAYRGVRNCDEEGGTDCPAVAKPILQTIATKETSCVSSCRSSTPCLTGTDFDRIFGKNVITNPDRCLYSYSQCQKYISAGDAIGKVCSKFFQEINSKCDSKCGAQFDPITSEVGTARDDATEDYLAARNNLTLEPEQPVTGQTTFKERYFRPLIGRAPDPYERPGVEISANGYLMASFLKEFAAQNNTSFSVYQSGGNAYLLRTDNQAQVLFDGIGVHQGEQVEFPWINANSFSPEKNASGFSGRIEGLENVSTSAIVDKIVSPDGKTEWLMPKLEIIGNAPSGIHPAEIVIERNGKTVKRIPINIEVEKSPLTSGQAFLFLITSLIFWSGTVYGLYKLIKRIRKKPEEIMPGPADYRKSAWNFKNLFKFASQWLSFSISRKAWLLIAVGGFLLGLASGSRIALYFISGSLSIALVFWAAIRIIHLAVKRGK